MPHPDAGAEKGECPDGRLAKAGVMLAAEREGRPGHVLGSETRGDRRPQLPAQAAVSWLAGTPGTPAWLIEGSRII
jgi:hypothetical protein